MAARDRRKTKAQLIAELDALRLCAAWPVEGGDIAESEELYRRLVGFIPDAVQVACGGAIVYANDAAVRLVGATGADQLVGHRTDEFILPEDRKAINARRRSLRAMEPVPMAEQRRRRLDGSIVDIEISSIGTTWRGKPATIAVMRDIIDRRQAEEALRRALDDAEFANRVKSEFLANMSHELRTPLNAIMGFSEVIQQELLGSVGVPQYGEYAGDIHAAGSHLLGLINDILDFAKIEAGMIELHDDVVDMAELIGGCVRMLKSRATAGKVKLAVRIAKTLPHLRGDELRIRQILLNLLSNASKFTPDGGTIRITVDADQKRGMRIRVVDTGIGIARKDLERVLQPFGRVRNKATRDIEGTGLGLPLTKTLVERHGGELDLKSRPGRGTAITVRFPSDRLVA